MGELLRCDDMSIDSSYTISISTYVCHRIRSHRPRTDPGSDLSRFLCKKHEKKMTAGLLDRVEVLNNSDKYVHSARVTVLLQNY